MALWNAMKYEFALAVAFAACGPKENVDIAPASPSNASEATSTDSTESGNANTKSGSDSPSETSDPLGCIVPKTIRRVAGTEEPIFSTHEAEMQPRSDGMKILTSDNSGKHHVVVEKDDVKIGETFVPLPAGGTIGSTLSTTGKFIITRYSRSGPRLTRVTEPKTAVNLTWDAIISPDDTYALEPAHAHGFTIKLEHHRDIHKVAFDPPKQTVIARVPRSAHGIDSDNDRMKMNQDTGVAICGTGAVYAISHKEELTVYRATDNAKLASFMNPGDGVPSFTRSGRFIVLGAKQVFELTP